MAITTKPKQTEALGADVLAIINQGGSVAGSPGEPAQQKRGPGRPPAKRSDPAFVQTSPYIRRETLNAVKMELLREGNNREYSELVEELLAEWLKRRKSGNSK